MDGVICNWYKSALVVNGVKPEDVDGILKNIPAIGGTDIASLFHGKLREEVLKAIDDTEDFWVNLETYPWTDDLVEGIRARNEFVIATSPSKFDGCPSQKVIWLQKYFHSEFRDYMIGKKKWLMANPNHILIDDTEYMVEDFRKKGGNAILFPQYWNKLSHIESPQDKLNYVFSELDKYNDTDQS